MMRIPSLMLILAGAVGCSFGDDNRNSQPDAAIDSSIDSAPRYTDHVLLSEVNASGAEFVEIWNPTSRTIDLANYYLSDVGNYWNLPTAGTLTPDSTDFVAQFPTGATLAPGAVATIAFNEAAFSTAFTPVVPTFALDATGGARKMTRVIAGAGTIQITNGGEYILLFYWDGTSDVVRDVDLVLAGKTVSAANALMSKESVDGPDADLTKTSYKLDAGMFGGGMSESVEVVAGTSYKRRTLETGAEAQNGTGNGITGDDETTEALKSTWDGDLAMPLSAPNPGVAPAI
jgi:uncharacterized protein